MSLKNLFKTNTRAEHNADVTKLREREAAPEAPQTDKFINAVAPIITNLSTKKEVQASTPDVLDSTLIKSSPSDFIGFSGAKYINNLPPVTPSTQLAANKQLRALMPMPEVKPVSEMPEVKPAAELMKNGNHWLNQAKQYGFNSIEEVAEWQRKNGLVADGKFGSQSLSRWNQLNGFATETPLNSEARKWHDAALKYGFANTDEVKLWQLQNGLVADGKFGPASEKVWNSTSPARYTNPYAGAYYAVNGPAYKKQGGTMNRINYFQQGGAAPQQDIKAQVTALVQAAMQGDQKATQQVNQIMEAAKAGDQQAIQIAQIMEQVIKELQGQATAAKWGAKLNYIRSLKYAKGGKTCPACEKKVEMKACGGKKAKKRYFGGLI